MNNNDAEKVYPSEKQLTDCSKDTNKRARLGIATTKTFFFDNDARTRDVTKSGKKLKGVEKEWRRSGE